MGDLLQLRPKGRDGLGESLSVGEGGLRKGGGKKSGLGNRMEVQRGSVWLVGEPWTDQSKNLVDRYDM